MTEIEYLGDALREQLHTLVADLEPSAALMARVDAIPTAPRPRSWRRWLRRRRIAFAVPVPAALVGAAAVLAFGAGGASVATPVTVLPGGAVRVTDVELFKVAATNALFRKIHVRNYVVVPLTSSCRNWDMSYTAGPEFRGEALRIYPRKLATGWTVVLGIHRLHNGDIEEAFGRFKTGHVATCASSHGWGEGMGSDGPMNPPKSK
jgi:hypothetical protein